jgi:hypothetical protein
MKPKVAICMRGAIAKESSSHFSEKGSLYNDSKYVNYKQCFNSIKKHIIEPNKDAYELDFFLHCWNTDLEDTLVTLYEPKAYIFDDNNDYADEILELCRSKIEFGNISHALSKKKVILLKEQYEKDNNVHYDLVVLYRYDVFLWKDMPLQNYDVDKIYANRLISPAAFMIGNGDFHFVMNSKNANEFKYLYDSIKLNNPCKGHFWIQNYIVNFMKQPLYEDDIVGSQHQEVIRRVEEMSINPGYLDKDTFLSYL